MASSTMTEMCWIRLDYGDDIHFDKKTLGYKVPLYFAKLGLTTLMTFQHYLFLAQRVTTKLCWWFDHPSLFITKMWFLDENWVGFLLRLRRIPSSGCVCMKLWKNYNWALFVTHVMTFEKKIYVVLNIFRLLVRMLLLFNYINILFKCVFVEFSMLYLIIESSTSTDSAMGESSAIFSL